MEVKHCVLYTGSVYRVCVAWLCFEHGLCARDVALKTYKMLGLLQVLMFLFYKTKKSPGQVRVGLAHEEFCTI